MNIALDLESTLAEVATAFRNEYENRNGERPGVWTEWNFDDAEFSTDEFFEITTSLWKHESLSIPAIERNVSEKTLRLHKMANRLDIVTGRRGVTDGIEAWLRHQGVQYDDLVVVGQQTDKAELNYDVYIDDAPQHVNSVKDDQTLFLYDRPHNRVIDGLEAKNITRITKLEEVYPYIAEAQGVVS
jgi:uncharacterized HAD superfamily protein